MSYLGMQDEYEKDNINPDHYKSGDLQCIDAIEASMTREQYIGYLTGNMMKYLWRNSKKHDDPIEDLKKAQWYLNRLINLHEQK